MRRQGQLYVFEGPDGVGKSELSKRLARHLQSKGIPTEVVAFPGNQESTLGKVIYDLHHFPEQFGISAFSPASRQLLHVAAHLDTIERTILPALRAGTTVVLDRFWWSTKVYGRASAVDRKTLDAIIQVEQAAWGKVQPTRIFLLTRETPLRHEPEALWKKLGVLYAQLASEVRDLSCVTVIENSGSPEATIEKIEAELESPARQAHNGGGGSQLGLQFALPHEPRKVPYGFARLAPARPTIVYDTYWRFAAERQNIFFRRLRELPPPWTDDPVLRKYKFTNAYRASDRVSQYLIKHVIYEGDQSPEEVFFRTILFKLFNKIETWERLIRFLGTITYREFDLQIYDRILSDAMAANERIYSAAYIMPSGSRSFGTTRKHSAHLRLLEQMMQDEVPLRIADAASMQDAFKIILSYPMMGDFLAYQYVTDLNYSTLTNFSEMEFVVPGPGAKGGISKCFESLGGLTEADIIRLITERQREEFDRLGVEFPTLFGRHLQLIDCQNIFCEVDKYSRVKHPEYSGTSGRTRIKQTFRPNGRTVNYWYPPKWGINAAIDQEKREMQNAATKRPTIANAI